MNFCKLAKSSNLSKLRDLHVEAKRKEEERGEKKNGEPCPNNLRRQRRGGGSRAEYLGSKSCKYISF